MTKVKVEFFKYTGKWYSSFECETELPTFEMIEIKKEIMCAAEFIPDMDFTIEVADGEKWNKYLFNSQQK